MGATSAARRPRMQTCRPNVRTRPSLLQRRTAAKAVTALHPRTMCLCSNRSVPGRMRARAALTSTSPFGPHVICDFTVPQCERCLSRIEPRATGDAADEKTPFPQTPKMRHDVRPGGRGLLRARARSAAYVRRWDASAGRCQRGASWQVSSAGRPRMTRGASARLRDVLGNPCDCLGISLWAPRKLG